MQKIRVPIRFGLCNVAALGLGQGGLGFGGGALGKMSGIAAGDGALGRYVMGRRR